MLLGLVWRRAIYSSSTASFLPTIRCATVRRNTASMHTQAAAVEGNNSSSVGGKSSQGGIDLSLHRITELLVRLSNPQSRFPIIHVAGTNSKGSTIAYLSSVLNHAVGIRVASFTSPHLIEERDCCKIGGIGGGGSSSNQVIDASIWEEAGRKVREAESAAATTTRTKSSASPGGGSNGNGGDLGSSPFELLTARCFVALDMLSPADRPEVVLVEVGMGGALDATNIFSPSQVLASVISPIDFDHQSFLGTTLRQIAEHKAGIIKQGGLCILADQRREQVGNENTEVDCTSVRATRGAGEEEQAFEVQDMIRQKCLSQKARFVKACVPWEALSSPSEDYGVHHQFSPEQNPWSASSTSHVRFTPVLAPSKIHQGDFVSATGDPVVPGPSLQLPRTRAALTGCHLALQTLWSIARDETPCALGQAGSDINEELRLRIAFALRDDPAALYALRISIEEKTHIPGRAEWVNFQNPAVKRPTPPATTTTAATSSTEEMDVDDDNGKEGREGEEVTPLRLHALVDGAHNASAATALRRGKDIQEILSNLFGKANSTNNGIDTLVDRLGSSRLGLQVSRKVACLPFTTPVEGMPWVSCVPPEELSAAIDTTLGNTFDENTTFTNLEAALLWAALGGNGKTITDEGRCNIVVIAGSLYLVSDVHRLLAASFPSFASSSSSSSTYTSMHT